MRTFRSAEVVLVAYAKSGRTWLSVLLSHVAHQKFGTPANELISTTAFRERYPEVQKFFLTADNFAPPRLSQQALLDLYKARKVILLVRDPRDIAVSLYFHLSKRGSTLERAVFNCPENVADIALFDFIRDERCGLAHIIDWLNRWVRWIDEIPQGLIISYEGLREDPPRLLAEVTDFIGWRCSHAEIQAAVDFASFEKLQGLERHGYFASDRMHPSDANDPNSYKVRRGKIGGYVDYLTPEQVAWMDAMVAERLDPALGYARSPAAERRAENDLRPGPTSRSA